jgi:hypothetical protein
MALSTLPQAEKIAYFYRYTRVAPLPFPILFRISSAQSKWEHTYVSPVSFAVRESPASVSRKSSTVVFPGMFFRLGRVRIAIRHLGSFRG